MPTITLVQAARAKADKINLMSAIVLGQREVAIDGLSGGAIQFTCSNEFAAIQGATSVKITYDASVPGDPHETIQVSSVQNLSTGTVKSNYSK